MRRLQRLCVCVCVRALAAVSSAALDASHQPQIGAVVNVAGCVLLSLIVPLVATQRRSAQYVFFEFKTHLAADVGITNWL